MLNSSPMMPQTKIKSISANPCASRILTRRSLLRTRRPFERSAAELVPSKHAHRLPFSSATYSPYCSFMADTLRQLRDRVTIVASDVSVETAAGCSEAARRRRLRELAHAIARRANRVAVVVQRMALGLEFADYACMKGSVATALLF